MWCSWCGIGVTWQTCVSISGCLLEQVHGKGLIAVKSSVVGADNLTFGWKKKAVRLAVADPDQGRVTFFSSEVLSLLAGWMSEPDMGDV